MVPTPSEHHQALTTVSVLEDSSPCSVRFSCLTPGVAISNKGAVEGCVRVLMKLNHKGVEPTLPAIWGVFFCQRRDSSQEASHAGDLCGLVEDCIHTYAKLKQLRVLEETQVEALRVLMELGMTPPTSPALPRRAEDMLCRYLQGLPLGQCVELMEVMVSSLQGDYLAKLPLATRSKRRKKASSSEPGEERDGAGEEGWPAGSLYAKAGGLVWCCGLFRAAGFVGGWGAPKGKSQERAGPSGGYTLSSTNGGCLSIALYLSYLVCQVTACLKVVHPSAAKDVWPLPLTWSEECHVPIPRVWASSPSPVSSLISSDPSVSLIMKHIAILCLKFGDQHVLQKELAEYVFADLGVAVVTDMNWSGQLLEVSERSLPATSLQLVLTQFPVLYHHCDHTHMRHVSDAILRCLLSCDSSSGRGCLPHTLLSFLQSPTYQDMKRLHDALIASVLTHSASKAPGILHEDIKCALRWSSEGVGSEGVESEGTPTCQEVLTPALMCALIGDEEWRGLVVKAEKRSLRYAKSLGVYVQVLSSVPMETLSIPTRLHLLVSSTCWHVAAMRHVMAASSPAQAKPPLRTLHSLLASTLASLVAGQRGVGRRKRKGVCPSQYLVPADLLARWSYVATRGLLEQEEASTEIVTSSLVVMETCVQWCLANSTSCEGILKEVATDLGAIPSRHHRLSEMSSFAEQCAGVIVSTVCKVYRDLSTSPPPCLTASLDLAITMVTKRVAQVLQWPQCHSALLTAFAELVATCARMLSPLSKVHACVLFKDVLDWDVHFDPSAEHPPSLADQRDMTLAVVDILMFPIYSSDLATEDPPSLPRDAVLLSWVSLHSHLSYLVRRYGYRETMDVYRETKGSHIRWEEFDGRCRSGDLTEGECLRALSGRVLKGLVQLLGVATREQTKAIFEHIMESGIGCPVSLSAFCLCWSVILDSKLTEESQRELRIWLCKVLLQCMSAVSVYSTESGLVAVVTELIGRLVAIPSQVGLDARSVVISLHACSALNGVSAKPSDDSVQLLTGMCHLLSAVVRNHAPVAGACPAAVVVSVNKLLEAVLNQVQEATGGQSGGTNEGAYPFLLTVTHCAALVSRLLEAVAKHGVLAKQALLPGVCCMIRACSDRDSAFIRTMLGQSDREGYQELLEEYKSYHRFTGRV
ncbi:hypothetical protein EMCRGX_G002414 [Ephydatia muelleri]